tara:strand:+ start:144 stop:824 length:681 start_codon:yes stop_codon:yes gene_type:complete
MKNILFCSYRDWSRKIYERVVGSRDEHVEIIYVTEGDDLKSLIQKHEPICIFFIGWSWIIEADIVNNYECICLHPSPLPKYRGGSPLQNQIINGEKNSAISLFLMDEYIDKGDILFQKEFSLRGNLSEIYDRITDLGIEGVNRLIDFKLYEGGKFVGEKQDHNKSTYYKRRKPSMSEIKIDDIREFTASQLHDKVRALQDPYPNAFITCKDGTKLFFKNTEVENEI